MVHLYGDCRWSVTKFMTFELRGIFIVSHLLWYGASILAVLSKGPPPPNLAVSYDKQGLLRAYSNPDPHRIEIRDELTRSSACVIGVSDYRICSKCNVYSWCKMTWWRVMKVYQIKTPYQSMLYTDKYHISKRLIFSHSKTPKTSTNEAFFTVNLFLVEHVFRTIKVIMIVSLSIIILFMLLFIFHISMYVPMKIIINYLNYKLPVMHISHSYISMNETGMS